MDRGARRATVQKAAKRRTASTQTRPVIIRPLNSIVLISVHLKELHGEGGGRGGPGLGTRVHPWRIHVDVWQNQYSTVK